jgi:hypothetical protein
MNGLPENSLSRDVQGVKVRIGIGKERLCPKCQQRDRKGKFAYCDECRSKYYRTRRRNSVLVWFKERNSMLKYRTKNRDRLLEQKNRRIQENTEWLRSYRPIKCEICGHDNERHIQLHHLDKDEKQGKHDTLSVWKRLTLKTFKRKILSCKFMLLCLHCHWDIHHPEEET